MKEMKRLSVRRHAAAPFTSQGTASQLPDVSNTLENKKISKAVRGHALGTNPKHAIKGRSRSDRDPNLPGDSL